MAESVNDQGTSLQLRILSKRVSKLEGVAQAARKLQVALLRGAGSGDARILARFNDHGVFEHWPHP